MLATVNVVTVATTMAMWSCSTINGFDHMVAAMGLLQFG